MLLKQLVNEDRSDLLQPGGCDVNFERVRVPEIEVREETWVILSHGQADLDAV